MESETDALDQDEVKKPVENARPDDSEPVWTYRGYELHSSEFTTSMVHLFRAEVSRANVWRQRLDVTTNWAVITAGAAITYAFSDPHGYHSVIILSTLLITLFLYVEARRYRYYELWSSRVRLMETDFFAAMLVPPFRPAPDWAESLAQSLLHPVFPISVWEALGRRLRNNYLWLYLVLGMSWLGKIWLQPTVVTSWPELIARGAVGGVPGWLVILAGLVFNGSLLLVGLFTISLHQATGEVLPRYALPSLPDASGRGRAWFRASRRRQQFLTFIITDRAQAVSDRILRDMHRGVTVLAGTGMYTGRSHEVLMCALTVTEIAQLKALVHEADPAAFVIVSPAREVLGRGFQPLQED